MTRHNSRAWFVAGLIIGLASFYAVLRIGGFVIVSGESLDRQQKVVAELRQENLELTEDLFSPRALPGYGSDAELPYDDIQDVRSRLGAAREEALAEKKFLMVTFGANWCMDCRNLHRNLNSEDVTVYTDGLFDFVNVDVGKFNRNLDVAEELGVTLSRGIPVAIVFDPQGKVIGTTNEGELEPARHYSSKQILRFVKDIVEQSRITYPDAVRK